MSQYLQVPQQKTYIIHSQPTHIINQSPSRKITSVRTVRKPSVSPQQQSQIIEKKQISPNKYKSQIITQQQSVSPPKKIIHIRQNSQNLPVPSPGRTNRLQQFSPQKNQRIFSPVKIIEQNLSYEEVMDRVRQDGKNKMKSELQMLEAELEEENDERIIALKKKIRSLEVQSRIQFKENKQDQKQLLEYKSKNIMLESQVQLLQKQLQDEKKEKELTEAILMQKIADLQIQNQDLSQLIYEQDSQQYIKKDKCNSEDQTFDQGSTLIHKNQMGQFSRGQSQMQPYENMLTPSSSYIQQQQ